jgi:pilus assembly protein CpaD
MTNTMTKFFLVAGAAALLTGCTGLWNGEAQNLSIAEEHPISVDSQVVTLTIPLGANGELSSLDRARLRAFGEAYLNSGYGPLTIMGPSGSSNDRNGQEQSAAARNYLNEIGVDWSQMNGAAYRAGDDRSGELVLSYTHYVATPSACGVWKGMMKRDYANLRSPNYGCATQNNLAAMIADPHDLVAPADETAPDAAMRIRAIQAYREGEVTSSAIDSEIKTEVASQ